MKTAFDIHVCTPMVLMFVSIVIPYNRHPNQALLGLRAAAAAAAATTCSTPSLAGTLLPLHSKPCWDTVPPRPLASSKNDPRNLLLCCCCLLAALQLLKTRDLRIYSVCFITVTRVTHSSKRTFVLLFVNHVGPLLYTQPRYFAYPSVPNLNIPLFLRSFVQSST